jgi:pimeloyl-ACP methyl ester carboxylesterase
MLAREGKHFGTFLAFDLKGHGMSRKEANGDYCIETLVAETI